MPTQLTETAGPSGSKPGFVLTGRHVLFALIGFFGCVFAMNFVMVRFALTTFAGVETESSYKAGLQFRDETQAAHAQDARGWQIAMTHASRADGALTLDITAKDKAGATLDGLSPKVRLSHPTNRRLDQDLPAAGVGPGLYRATGQAQPGQWDVIVEFWKGDERVYRSRSRVTLDR